MLYSLLRPLLFNLNPETAHSLTLGALKNAHRFGLLANHTVTCQHRNIMGLNFPNSIGLAAGLDKNGEHINTLATLGFGFIEIGTTTPRPQTGNQRPRVFRIPQASAIINRLGFNNHGVDELIINVKRSNYKGVLGINIGKNADTPIENAVDDYLICLRKVYCYASYVAINISSPNTLNLRQLQDNKALDYLLDTLKIEQKKLSDQHGKYTPLVVKIAPDLETLQIQTISNLLIKHRIDGVIATNSTLSRTGVENLPYAKETGGLSGAPLTQRANKIIRQLHGILQGAMPIIGVGGVMSAIDAKEKMDAGASLVQIYTGLIYRGPSLIREAVQAIHT